MKLNPNKLKLGREVKMEGLWFMPPNKWEESVYLPPSEDKLKLFQDIKTPQHKTVCKCITGMAAQLKKFVPGLMLKFAGIQKMKA